LDAEVLCAGVEPIDLGVGCVGDQGDLADVVVFGELHPRRDGRRVLLHRNDLDAYIEGREG
jgi:hypothetical protein